eukprot:TRINITY_DN565_c0_g1_i1.p1 TRINITY_DN565_c0_g1~~TRINITY_DN565_c0_g1_i1.p1  ORF type:complete len:230 (-),score=42.09 TRINITY_DN565_c0_g1_i1:137-826(-)
MFHKISISFILSVILSVSCTLPGPGDDPADSWLAYAVASGNGNLVTYVNATWTVPAYPTTREGGNAPGWWFGIEPNPASDLIQPILAYGFTGDNYVIFNGYYQWDNSDWWYSDVGSVVPGNTVYAEVSYDSSTNSYNMNISCIETGWSVTSNIAVESGKLYTDVYFVVEHQPNTCSEYPADGKIVFKDIHIVWQKGGSPQWKGIQYQDACNCTPTIIDPATIQFTWDTQ